MNRGPMGRRLKLHYLIIVYMLLSCASAANCGDCESHWANLTNIGLVNATGMAGMNIGLRGTYEDVNVSYRGCPDLNNTVVANATDQFGHILGPKVVYQQVNLTYFAGLDITKIPQLVTNLSHVGPDLVLVEYNIIVTNIGQVNITGIWVYDPLLGNYTLGKLMPGENVTINPNPYYILTPDDIQYCSINNVVLVQGTDRCCNPVDGLAYASFPLAAKNLETYLKIYSYELMEYGYALKEDGDAGDLARYEEMIRIQANRLMVLEDEIKKNVTSCRSPPQYNLVVAKGSDCLGGSCQQKVAYETVYPQLNKTGI